MTPQSIARLFMKMGIVIMVITFILSALNFFPYYLYLHQMADDILLKTANYNYITKSELQPYYDTLKNNDNLWGRLTLLPTEDASLRLPGINPLGALAEPTIKVFGCVKNSHAPVAYSDWGGESRCDVIPISGSLTGGTENGTLVDIAIPDGAFSPYDPLVAPQRIPARNQKIRVEIQSSMRAEVSAMGKIFVLYVPVRVSKTGTSFMYYKWD